MDSYRLLASQAGGYIEIPSNIPTTSARTNSPRGIAHAGVCNQLSWDDGGTFELTLQNDTYISVHNRGTDHFHSWYRLPDGTQHDTPDGILFMPQNTYLNFQDSDIFFYLDMQKYYVKYE